MIKRYDIKNLDDLKLTQSLLKAQYKMQGELIRKDAASYIRKLSPTYRLLKVHSASKIKRIAASAMPAKVFSSLVPYVLNKTLFKKSGWLKKIAVYVAAKMISKKI